MRVHVAVCILIVSLVLTACHSKSGTINGTVSPATADVRVTVKAGPKTILSVSPDRASGVFSLSLAPGTYDVSISSPSSPFPVSFSEVIVEPGKSVSLGIIQLASAPGTGTITGRIAGGAGARVSLFTGGQERASAATDPSGKYELKELPAGTYQLQVRASGYAEDARTVVLSEGQQAAMNVRLILVTALEGVDWTHGMIRVRGVGSPPSNSPTPTIRREMAKRAALAAAERDLLRVVGLIETGPGENMSQLLGQSTYTQRLEGYLKGFRIAAERDLDGGRIEVELELPLTGPAGLSSYLPLE